MYKKLSRFFISPLILATKLLSLIIHEKNSSNSYLVAKTRSKPKLCFAIIILSSFSSTVFGQISGVKHIPGDYSTLTAAIADLNSSGVGAGGVIFNISAGFTETITSTLSVIATGTAADPVVFQRDPVTIGVNPVITAYASGTSTPASAVQDGILCLVGSDYVTIDGIDLSENSANVANPATMEYGYALYKASSSNGCQFVIIKNCSITLNRINNETGTTPMVDGSSGIIVMNALRTAAATRITAVAGGVNSNNKFYHNTIQNCNTGIALIGYAAASPFTLADYNNDIGGSSPETGNTIINYGGAAGSTMPAVAIRTLAQYDLKISNNLINNNKGAGVNHPNILRGIYTNTAINASETVTYNTITLSGGGTTQSLSGIENDAGSTANNNTVNISNNTIINSAYATATTGGFYGIRNTAAPATLIMSNDTISNNSTAATTTGFWYGISNSGTATNVTMSDNLVSGNSTANFTTGLFVGVYNTAASASLNMNNNTIAGNSSTSASGLYSAISNAGMVTSTININGNNIGNGAIPAFTFNAANSGAQIFVNNISGAANSALSISNNNFQGFIYAVGGTGSNTYINNTIATRSQAINNNTFTNLNVNTSGSLTFISNSVIVSGAGTQNVNSNTIVGSFTKASGGAITLFTSSATSLSGAVVNNNNNDFSNITAVGNTAIAGWVNIDAGAADKSIKNNTFTNWTTVTGAITAMNVGLSGANNAITGNAINTMTGGASVTGITSSLGNSKIYSNIIHTLVSAGTTSTTISGISITGGTAQNIYQNTIYNLQGSSISTGSVRGIVASAGATINIYQNTIYSLQANLLTTGFVSGIWGATATTLNIYGNKIYDLSSGTSVLSSGNVNGVQVSGSTSNSVVTIRNNLIGDLRATAASATDAIRGITLTSTGLTSLIEVYNNTIYLNAVSSGATFGTTGIYHTTATVSSSASLDLRNNIIINTSTPAGAGFTVAYRRSTSSLTNYLTASNNNLFYAGVAASNRLLYFDGTNADQLLSTYKPRMSARDAETVTEDMITASKFLSVLGSSPSFLHVNPAKPSQIESGAISAPSVTIDFDGETRQGISGYAGTGFAPDIGADEVEGIRIAGLSGTYNVGPGQVFTSLTNADGLFANINTRGLAGNVVINITADLTEDGTHVLYQWLEQGIGTYTLKLQPDAASVRVISGNVLAGLLRLNGADRVTIDGRNSGTGVFLTFRNSNTAGTTGTAFTFINGASNNLIRNCNVEAYGNATNGTILFSTSTVAGGNSNNIISNCIVNATVAGNTGVLCIYSGGTVGRENASNTIASNAIFNYRDRGIDITATGSTGWIVSGNSLYNGNTSGTINYAAASTLHGIRVLGGAGYSILNNYIGGNAALASGTPATYSSTLGNVSYQGILLTTTGATPASLIKGNKIAAIFVSSVPTAAGSNAFIGIETNGTGINIGGSSTGDGNTIGSTMVNSSVTINTATTSSTFTSLVRGIYCASTGGLIMANQIGGIDIQNTGSAPASSSFIGIYVNIATAPTLVSNNVVGIKSVANSIRVLSTSTAITTALSGITIGTAVVSTLLVDGNIVQNMSNLNSVNTTGAIIGISSSATTSAANVTISNNTVSSLLATSFSAGTGTPLSSFFVGINNSGGAGTLRINNNIVKGLTTNSTAGNVNAIRNTGAVVNTIQINNNQIGDSATSAVTYTAANGGSQIFINNTGGASTAALSISSNNFQGITYAVAGTGTSTFILNSAATLSQAINGNTFSSLNVNTAGSVTFISNNVVVGASGVQNVNNNSIVTSFTKRAGGTLILFTSSATSLSGSVTNNIGNNFSYITVTGATTIAGWVNTDAGVSLKTIASNIFTNWVGGTSGVTVLSVNLTGSANSTTGNLISNISGGAAITAISSGAGNDNISLNTIHTLTTTGASAVIGIAITSGSIKSIFRNKIFDLQSSAATGSAYGISVSGGATVKVYNNLIGDLRTPTASSATDLIRGISVTSTTAASSVNIYYNTIYLNGASTGTNFSSSGIYHTSSATATTAALDLRNNSITNTSTPKGTGLAVAYRRSSSTLTNYVSTSNNNLFYAGTPGTAKLIYYDVTNSDQTISAFKTRVSARDAASVSEDLTTKFLSVAGSSPLFLHMSASISSLIESGAANIAGYTDDFDAQVRAGNPGYSGASSSPDIGADEVFGLETTPPSITYPLLSNLTSTVNRDMTDVIITDGSGVNIAPGTKPRIYYKRSSDANVWLDNSSNTGGWKFTESSATGSPFSFTIDYALLNGGASVTAGPILYFIVAQDISTNANIGINSGTFSTPPTSVNLTSTAFPIGGIINRYSIPFSGSYSVGTDQIFTSLTKSNGLFAAINSAGLMGNATINIESDLAEDGTNALNQWTESGLGNYTINIQPDAAILRTISGDAVAGLIRLNGADRVQINGNSGGSGSYLSFRNTNTSGATGTAFTFINGATRNTLQYCNIESYANATNGVVLFGASAVAGGNSHNRIDNCTINATVSSNTGTVAVFSEGTVSNENSSDTISNNIIKGYKTLGLDINATGSTGWSVSSNSFHNGEVTGSIDFPAATSLYGIRILGGSGYSLLNNFIGGSEPLASGDYAVYTSTFGNIDYHGIMLSTTAGVPTSYIKGNTVAAIAISTIPTSGNSDVFTGIETTGSGVNIGGSAAGEGNTIGSTLGNSSISIATSTTATANTSIVTGIKCTSSGGLVIGNHVGSMDILNEGSAPAASSFTGLYINSSSAPSQIISNIIGSQVTDNSIRVLASSTATTTSLSGIAIGSAVDSDILLNKNKIQSLSQLSTASSGSFTGISNQSSSGVLTISNDTIQHILTATNGSAESTVYTGIYSSSTSVINNNIINNISLKATGANAQIIGINVTGASASTISNNIVSNLSTTSTKENNDVEMGNPVASALIGVLNSTTVSGQLINNNRFSDFNATSTAAVNVVVTVLGITSTGSGSIFNNRFGSSINLATGSRPALCHIMAAGGSFDVYNNASRLSNVLNTNSLKMYGFVHAAASDWKYYHNTIRVGGNSTGAALRSTAFLLSGSSSPVLMNNIFTNVRSGSGSNYAISNLGSPPSSWLAATSDYNAFYSINSATTAEWGNGIQKSFVEWKNLTGGDSHSINNAISFINSTYDLEPDSITNCNFNNAGIPITTPVLINTDINAKPRNMVAPDIGAYEFHYTGFTIIAGSNSPVCSGDSLSFTLDTGLALAPSFAWSDPSNVAISTLSNPKVLPMTGFYKVIVTDSTGCSVSDSALVSINSRPTATITAQASLCDSGFVTLDILATGTGLISGTLSSGELFSGTASLISTPVFISTTTSFYISDLSDDVCPSIPQGVSDTVTVIVAQPGGWLGRTADWSDPVNWCEGVAPTSSTDVTIPEDIGHYPLLNTGSGSVQNITIESGASLVVANATLHIAGNIDNSGILDASNGSIEMNGVVAQTIPADAFSGTVNDLTINNNAGVSLAGPLSLTNILTLSRGSLASDGYLTLKSTDSGTASVASITSLSSTPISGNVTVERYVMGRRKYRLITSSVTTHPNTVLVPGQESRSIWGNWQNEGSNIVSNTGTFVTGGTSGDGFDTQTGNASLYTYNDVTTRFVGFTTANGKNTRYTSLKAGVPYYMFVYGDRTKSLSTSSPNSTVLSATGTLLTGTQTYNTASGIPLSAVTDRFTLLGNPYASPIDWATLPKVDISNTYWGWDPNLSSTGGYVTVSTIGDVTLIAPFSGTTGLNQYIQSGQGFFVKTTGAAPSLLIREQDKSGVFNASAFRVASNMKMSSAAPTMALLAINLQYNNAGISTLADGVLCAFGSAFSNTTGSEDASKMANNAENIAIAHGDKLLSIDARQMPIKGDTILLKTSGLVKSQYMLQIFANQNGNGILQPWLQDRYLNTVQILSLRDTNNIAFSVHAGVPASAAQDRFRIVFEPSGITFPRNFISIAAGLKDKGVIINWKNTHEIGLISFDIQRSRDGANFRNVGSLDATDIYYGEVYEWFDLTPVAGFNYYRIRATGIDGRTDLSSIAQVDISQNNQVIDVFPNPVKNKQLNIHSNQMKKGKYVLQVLSAAGQQAMLRIIDHPGGIFSHAARLDQSLPAGVYYLRLSNEEWDFSKTIFMK